MSTIFTLLLAGLSLASTSSDPVDREDQLADRKCATTYKRMLNFVKYWAPGSNNDYIMYNPDKIGVRGYDLLGDVYYRGCTKADLAPDKAAAVYWYQAAAFAHVPDAQWKLGKMLIEGDGIPSNQAGGLAWLTSAAIEGSEEAAGFLRKMNEPVPQSISPNSYAVTMEQAKLRLEDAQAAERQRVVSDLSNLVISVSSAYLLAQAKAPSVSSPHVTQRTAARMTQPTFCSTYVNGTETGNTVWLRINQFCH